MLSIAFDTEAVLARGDVERGADAGVMNVTWIGEAQKVVVSATIVNVSAIRIGPDSVVVFTLVEEFVGEFIRGTTLIGHVDTEDFRLGEGIGDLHSVWSASRKGFAPACLKFQSSA
jgi:hypothetical protein